MSEQPLADLKTKTEIDKMNAEIDKLRAETRKILKETVVVPFLAGAACMAALTGLAGVALAVIVKYL